MEEWEKIARSLPCGRSVRIKCCRADRSQVISHTEHGYSSYCFRCGGDSRKFKAHGVRSLSELINHRKELDAYIAERGTITLPNDFTRDIPQVGLLWFLKYGVSSDVARHYGFGWSESMGRVVIPVYDEVGRLCTTQSRAVYPGQKPKYMNKKSGDMTAVAFHSDDALLLGDPIQEGIVITEDILSAVRVGRLMPALSTLGTHLSDKLAVRVLKALTGRVFIWYDGDEAGVRGARKAYKTLKLQGANPIIIKTEKDPKEYNNDEIREIIKFNS